MKRFGFRPRALLTVALLIGPPVAAQDTPSPTPTVQEAPAVAAPAAAPATQEAAPPAVEEAPAPEKPYNPEAAEHATSALNTPSLESNVQQPTAPMDGPDFPDLETKKDGFHFTVDPAVLDFRIHDDDDAASAKYQEYRDFYSGFGVPQFRMTGESADFNKKLEISTRNVGRKDAFYFVGYEDSGRFSVSVEDNHIPHNFGNDGTLLHSFTDAGVLEISDSAQAQLEGVLEQQFAVNKNAINFDFLNALITPYIDAASRPDFGLQRERTRVRADLAKLKTFSVSAEVFHENRDGTRPYGSSFGFNGVTELPEPIDYDTLNVTLAGEWNAKRAGARVGVRHSSFTNHIDALLYDNPWRATDSTDGSAYQSPSSSSVNGSSRGQNALAPDNTADELFATGQVRFGETGWVHGSLNFISMSQDDDFLPYTVNTSINQSGGAPFDATDPSNLPVRAADSSVNVLNFAVGAGMRVFENLDVRANLRRYDYNDDSATIEIPGYTRFDAVWEPIGRISAPFDYAKTSFGVEAAYRLGKRSRIMAGYGIESWDRDRREVDSSDEGVLHLGFTTRAINRLSLRADYRHGDKSVDEYLVEAQEESFTDPEGVNNQATLRKYDQAARSYDDLSLQATYALGARWSLTGGFSTRMEEYQDEDGNVVELGLQSQDLVRFNAEVSFAASDATSLYVFADHADRDVVQRARQSGSSPSTNPIDNWGIDFDEVNDTLGGGVSLSPGEKWRADFSAAYSSSDGAADFSATPGGAPLNGRPAGQNQEPLDIDNYEDVTLTAITASVDYAVTPAADIGLVYRYEDYSIDSFITQGLTTYLPGALILNANNGDYSASIYASRLRIRF